MAKATGPTYRTTLRTVIRNSYKGHYRRMVPQILQALDFRSNNRRHRPVIQALDLLKRYADTKLHTFPADEDVPIDGVARGLWREAVVEKDAEGRSRVNRITYEICVLEALRDKLRCKEVWVVGANRYRNPDDDVPADFEAQRTPYYQALNLPLEADRFIADVQAEMRQALHTLDAGLPTNALVRIGLKRGRLDHRDAARRATRPAQPDRAQGRGHRDLADDQPARHGQGSRSAAALHRGPEEPDRLRDAWIGPSCDHGSCSACTGSGPTPACSAWPGWSPG